MYIFFLYIYIFRKISFSPFLLRSQFQQFFRIEYYKANYHDRGYTRSFTEKKSENDTSE